MGFNAEIVTFDKATMRAEIKPLLRAKTEEDGIDSPEFLDSPIIDNVPVQILFAGSAYIRPDYKKGDKVKCMAVASSIDQPLNFDVRSDMLKNRFSLSYCTVVNGVIPENFSLPSSFDSEDGLLIGNGSTFMVFKSDEISVTGEIKVLLDVTAATISLKNHIHSFVGLAPGAPGVTGAPVP